ncbi:MAG: hypothetical protein NTZ85_01630 [Bacteroidia bacterium]|nr:hypothetical protein [Bacteroidia bacterium]
MIQNINCTVTPISYEQTFSAVRSDLLPELRILAGALMGMIKERVVTKGQKGSMQATTPYSDSWSKVRTKHGLQTGIKTFKFSGQMWNSFDIVGERSFEGGAEVSMCVTGENKDSDRTTPRMKQNLSILEGHYDREGENILEFSEDEGDKIVEKLSEWINMEFEK